MFTGTELDSSNLLGKYCGRQVTIAPVLSGSGQMLAKFRSDSSVNYSGFSATYKAGKYFCFVNDYLYFQLRIFHHIRFEYV